MSYNPQFIHQDPLPTLSIRTTTDIKHLKDALGTAYQTLGEYLDQLGEQPAGAPYAAYFTWEKGEVDVEIGFPVSKSLPGQGQIKATHLPGDQLASCLYTGPYNKIEPAYNALTEFVERSGRQATGVAYEFYLNDANEVEPQELMTQIVFPLKES